MPLMLPASLRPYVITQEYDRYTPIDQAVWRYVMRQNHAYLSEHAHPAYLAGLAASGITLESIPHTDHMNRCLERYGWQVVNVSGFIPPAEFMEFQAAGILPIALDIRTAEHISYTPAPDILHEAAGHAPFLCDPEFGSYVRLLAELGAKARFSDEDVLLYEAIRHLSIVKEDPRSTPTEIAAAERRFADTQASMTGVSQAALISRLYWWTVEYGLIGSLEAPRIYGAGLLSSVGEAKLCMTERVRKLPFDLDACLGTSYDITAYQPQLFVCESFQQLVDAVHELARRMRYSFEEHRCLDPAPPAPAHLGDAGTPREEAPPVSWTPEERALHALFAEVRAIRQGPCSDRDLVQGVAAVAAELDRSHPSQWLLRLELLELLAVRGLEPDRQAQLRAQLHALRTDEDTTRLIDDGLGLVAAPLQP